jgi:hypothetical protein
MRLEAPAEEVLEVAEVLSADDTEAEEQPRKRRRRKGKFAPCPSCGDTDAKRVVWTFWGSFYGPALFNHVRCVNCGAAYNGRTGRSNLIPAILFLTVSAMLVIVALGVVGVLLWTWWSRVK